MDMAQGQQHPRSGAPAWRSIAATLAGEIRQGRWRDGEPLPPAGELATRFGVHRHTVRKSLSWLRAQGLLSAPPARARAIVPRLPLPLQACIFLPEHLRGLGLEAHCELLACTVVPLLPAHLGERAPVQLRGPLLHLACRVVSEGQPLALTEAWLPAAGFSPVPAYLSEGHSLGSALRRGGALPACRRHAWVEAESAASPLAGAPLALHVGVLALDAQSHAFKLCLHHFDATRIRLLI